MPRRRQEIRSINGQPHKWCNYHDDWHPVDDFGPNESGDASVPGLRASCRLAEQTKRDVVGGADPARAAIVNRAKHHASDLTHALGRSISYQWILAELHWIGLVPIMRALLGPDGTCLNCGRHQGDARRYHICHRFPAQSLTDWPAWHARALDLWCGGCNWKQGRNPTDRELIDKNMRKWMIDRRWADHAGEKGWPAWQPEFGQPTHTPDVDQLTLMMGAPKDLQAGAQQISLFE